MKEATNKAGVLGSAVAVLSSLRLTVALLGLCMILIFVATLLQVKLGIYEVQQLYFRSWIAWFDLLPGEKKLSIPFPGGMLLGSLLLLNLLAAHIRRFQFRWQKTGLILVHLGIVLMLLGELFTALFSEESQMRLDEGKISNYSTSPREIELVVIDASEPGMETVKAIPFSRLHDGASFKMDGFELRVLKFFRNSELEKDSSAGPGFDAMRANQGVGVSLAVKGKSRETAMDRRDLSSAFVEVIAANGESKGRWLLSNALAGMQDFELNGKKWEMAIRSRRFYHPFSIKLLDFTHERYLGTQIPKNFSSRIRLINLETDEDRETLIYMNHPLRYQGLTFYQSGFDNNDETSILQVVRNPAWTMPYFSCAMVGVGLLWIFSQHLIKAMTKRRKPAVT